MLFDHADESQKYFVLVNDEEQYSIWPSWKTIPNGWRQVKEGLMRDCAAYVDSVWTDMRPLSLRKRMDSSPA